MNFISTTKENVKSKTNTVKISHMNANTDQLEPGIHTLVQDEIRKNAIQNLESDSSCTFTELDFPSFQVSEDDNLTNDDYARKMIEWNHVQTNVETSQCNSIKNVENTKDGNDHCIKDLELQIVELKQEIFHLKELVKELSCRIASDYYYTLL